MKFITASRPAVSSRLATRIAVLFLTCTIPTLAQTVDIPWYALAGGGAIVTTGGSFELSGTIGQPSASSFAAPLAGGNIELISGFWPVAEVACTQPGDMNADGLHDGLDIQAFVNCLLGATSNCACADLDGNGAVDTADASLLVHQLLP